MQFLVEYGSYLLVPLHILVCLILIAVVLLQTGKGGDWASVFGGAGSQTAFGPRGVENTLSRVTKFAAVIFMITALSLSLIQSKTRGGGGLPDLPARQPLRGLPQATPTPAGAESAAPQPAPEAPQAP